MKKPLDQVSMVGLLVFATASAALPISSPAGAQSCQDDADCDEGLECRGGVGSDVRDNGAVDVSGAIEGDAEAPPATASGEGDVSAALMTKRADDDAGRCVVAPRPCDTDSDCDEHYACVAAGDCRGCTSNDAGEATAPPAQAEPRDADAGSAESDSAESGGAESSSAEAGTSVAVETKAAASDEEAAGYCEAQPIECDSDSDCADPLVCEDGQCAIQFVVCESDDDCEGGEECVAQESQSCSGSGSVSVDEDGNATEEAFEEECTTDERRFCFPEREVCEADNDCDDDASCFDFSTFRGGPPPFWQDTAAACLPEGWVLAISGHAEPTEASREDLGLGSSASGGGASSGNASSNPASDADEDESDLTLDGETDDAAKATNSEESDEEGAQGRSGGCALNAQARGSSAAGLLMAALSLLLARGRRRLGRER